MSTNSRNASGSRASGVGVSEAQVQEALRTLEAAPDAAFDGHTEFHRLTPAERLEWMDGALALIESRRGQARRPAGG